MVTLVISGAQTGADIAGLRAAHHLGIHTAGTVPAGRRTERGPLTDEIMARFHLAESPSRDYRSRTLQNVLDADGTVIFAKSMTTGSALTRTYAMNHSKPYLWLQVDSPTTRQQFRDWLTTHNIATLNVAGNRESINPGIEERVFNFLVATLR